MAVRIRGEALERVSEKFIQEIIDSHKLKSLDKIKDVHKEVCHPMCMLLITVINELKIRDYQDDAREKK